MRHPTVLAAIISAAILSIAGVLVLANHFNTDSRIASCQQTYRAFPLMFQPFFPPDPADWTEQQMSDWEKLGARAEELAAGCSHQVKGDR